MTIKSLSSMWCVLRLEYTHGLKRCNERRMARGQTTSSLSGTASLGLLFGLFHSYNFYCRFPENDCSFDGLLTLLRESGRHSKSSVKAVAIFLFFAIKSTHVFYHNNPDATFRLLISGKINPNSGPVSASTAGKINCLVMNARSLKCYHKYSTTN